MQILFMFFLIGLFYWGYRTGLKSQEDQEIADYDEELDNQYHRGLERAEMINSSEKDTQSPIFN